MAKTSVLTIMIQLAKRGDADRETIKGLAQLKQNIGLAVGAFTAFSGVALAAGKALGTTVTAFVDYAAQVRELNRLTGAGAEETSRIIQAADDMTISYESLQKALWFASKKGVEVNIESLARLADEYVALNGPTAQATFLAKEFGKSGADMGKLLEQGGAGVRAATDAISGSLVLTDDAVRSARDYEKGVDNLTDSWNAFKVLVGGQIVPLLNNLFFRIENHNEIQERAKQILLESNNAQTGATALYYDQAVAIAEVQIKHEQWLATAQKTGPQMSAMGGGIVEVTDATIDAADAQALFNSQLDQLKGFIGGDLTQAWEDHNAAIADYKVQLEQAKTAEDKRDIQTKIDAETEAYNKRAASIMFNIQQEAILAGVQSGEIKSGDAIAVLGQLADSYGLIDERQKHAMNSSASLISQWAAGNITTEQLTGLLQANTVGMQDNTAAAQKLAGVVGNTGDEIYHTGQRAEGTEPAFIRMKDAQASLADGINKGAAPAVGNLKKQINGLPADGSSWNWTYSITGTGRFPTMPSRGHYTGAGAHEKNNPGYENEYDLYGYASGGQLAGGWSLVGEQGPELITPQGFVIPNRESMAILASGLNPEFQYMAGGETSLAEYKNITTAYSADKRAKAKRRSSSPVSYSSGSNSGSDSAVVADVVAPMTEATTAAVQSSAAAQQQAISEGIQTRNTIQQGNSNITDQLQTLNDNIQRMNATMKTSIVSAVQQATP